MSDSVRPHRRQPTRLPCPWDSPGKNTGVGCYFLLPCMKVKSEREVAQLSPTSSDPMDCSLPRSSIHGIFQARVLEWGAIAFSESHTSTCKSSPLTVLKRRTLALMSTLTASLLAMTASMTRTSSQLIVPQITSLAKKSSSYDSLLWGHRQLTCSPEA